jgi:hypothetical protein
LFFEGFLTFFAVTGTLGTTIAGVTGTPNTTIAGPPPSPPKTYFVKTLLTSFNMDYNALIGNATQLGAFRTAIVTAICEAVRANISSLGYCNGTIKSLTAGSVVVETQLSFYMYSYQYSFTEAKVSTCHGA